MELDAATAARFARLALDCVHREYPNKIAHTLVSDRDVTAPRLLTPAFYGCYDWHSAVHGHWLLARVARLSPSAPFAAEARLALERSITTANIEAEVKYQQMETRGAFERPYGLAWLLQLAAELRESMPSLAHILQPLEAVAVERLETWLLKLPFPVRSGEHSNTAFALGLALDWSRVAGMNRFGELVARRARDFYFLDRACPVAWEPGGEDFLSPCLAEGDLMRRILGPEEFAAWLDAFLPDLSTLRPAVSPDPSDPKLAHLDGLNLSRAWMLAGIASGLAREHPRRPELETLKKAHAESGLAAVTAEHYEGSHWLGTFAVYLFTQ